MRQATENTLVTGAHAGRYHFRKLIDWYDSDIVLDAGKDLQLTRREAATKYGCVNFRALRNLGSVLKAFDVKSIDRLSQIDPHAMMNTEGVGFTTMYAAMCLLDKHGYDVGDWWRWEDKRVHTKKPGQKQPRPRNGNGKH